jgi:hypothetical protein
MALSGALSKVTLAIAHLLAMVERPGPIDGLEACIVLQSISSMGWSPAVVRLAKRLAVQLPETPLQAMHGAPLREATLPPVLSVRRG